MQPSSTGTLLGPPPLVFQPSRVLPSKSRIQPSFRSSGESPSSRPPDAATVGQAASATIIPNRPAVAIVRLLMATS